MEIFAILLAFISGLLGAFSFGFNLGRSSTHSDAFERFNAILDVLEREYKKEDN